MHRITKRAPVVLTVSCLSPVRAIWGHDLCFSRRFVFSQRTLVRAQNPQQNGPRGNSFCSRLKHTFLDHRISNETTNYQRQLLHLARSTCATRQCTLCPCREVGSFPTHNTGCRTCQCTPRVALPNLVSPTYTVSPVARVSGKCHAPSSIYL